jgi:hypothetical protein
MVKQNLKKRAIDNAVAIWLEIILEYGQEVTLSC